MTLPCFAAWLLQHELLPHLAGHNSDTVAANGSKRSEKPRPAPAAYVKERGAEDVKADDIVRAIKSRGRQRVPDHVKAELLTQLRKFIITGS